MAQWINPDRGELFYARRVVFVEGETEKVILPFLAEKLAIFDPDVSIIDCGSKYNLPLYATIANAFSIPYLVVHDEDPLPDPIPDEWEADRKTSAKRTFDLNRKIADIVEEPYGTVHTLSPYFENIAGVSRSQGKRKGIIYKSPETQALTTVPGLSDPPGFDGTEDCPRQLSHSIEWGLSRHLQIELLFLLRLRRLVRRMDQFYCSGFRILANFGFPIAHFPALSPSGEGLQSDAFAQVSS